jgi:hypothetical protein
MSPEEIERTMQFILQQQAQFVTGMDKLSVKTDHMAEGLIGLTAIVGHLAESQRLTGEQLKATDRQLEATNQGLGGLGDYIKTVESHLDILIEMFERHLRDDHGAAPPS